MKEIIDELIRMPMFTFIAFMIGWTMVTAFFTAVICGNDLKHENAELKADNMKLRFKNKQLEGFYSVYKEEQDKAYIRGYYDSIGGYDI